MLLEPLISEAAKTAHGKTPPTKRHGGQSSKLTDDTLQLVAELAAEGQTKQQIAAAIGVHANVITYWLSLARKNGGTERHKALLKIFDAKTKKSQSIPTDLEQYFRARKPQGSNGKRRCFSWLADPLTPEEQRVFKQMAKEHAALLRYAGGKLCNKYWFVSKEDVFSCINAAFLKACRAWEPKRGTFSTCFLFFANGECLHWIRDKNFYLKSTGRTKDLAREAQKLYRKGMKPSEILSTLNITADRLRDSLNAVQGVYHDVKGFDLHCDQRMTPMERLELEEEQAVRLERARELMPDFDERVEAMEQELLSA